MNVTIGIILRFLRIKWMYSQCVQNGIFSYAFRILILHSVAYCLFTFVVLLPNDDFQNPIWSYLHTANHIKLQTLFFFLSFSMIFLYMYIFFFIRYSLCSKCCTHWNCIKIFILQNSRRRTIIYIYWGIPAVSNANPVG